MGKKQAAQQAEEEFDDHPIFTIEDIEDRSAHKDIENGSAEDSNALNQKEEYLKARMHGCGRLKADAAELNHFSLEKNTRFIWSSA